MRRILTVSLVFVILATLLTGTVAGAGSGPLVIKWPHYQVGNVVAAGWRADTIKAFNQKFKGKYQMVLEEIGSDQLYKEKLKVLNAADELPPLLEAGKDPALCEIMIKQGRLADLKPYLDADPKWKSTFFPDSIEYNTYDGKILTLPMPYTNYIGMFYNKELFAKAGIKEFPKTWDDFFTVCEKLKAKGITPLAMTTAENAWCSNLILTAMIAGDVENGGTAWMKSYYPTDFETNKAFISAVAKLQKLFKYATPDSIGAPYATASNNFCSGRAAIIANGPWMIDTFKDPKSAPEGFVNKVGYALYPGNVGISNVKLHTWAISSKAPKEVRDACAEYLKLTTTGKYVVDFMVQLGYSSPYVPIPASILKKQPQLTQDALKLGGNVKIITPAFADVWDGLTANEASAKEMPLLAMGQITPEEYAKRMTAYAKKYAASKNEQ